jgi:hypothetical protein
MVQCTLVQYLTSFRETAPSGPAPAASACEPYREVIEAALGRGREAMAIWRDLVDDHGFPAQYASVRRFAPQGGALPSSVHAPEAQAYLAPRLTHGSVSRRRFLRTSVRILLETDERGHVRRRVGTALAPTLGVGFEPAVRAYRLFLHEHRRLGERTIGKRAVPTGLQRPRMGGCVTLTGAQGWGGRRRRGLMLPYALRASGVDHRAPK